MSPCQVRILTKSLLNKGFYQEAGGRHKKLRLHANGNRTKIFTLYSHSATECNDFILDNMAKQLKLTRSQFNNLIECTLSEKDYLKILIDKGELIARAVQL